MGEAVCVHTLSMGQRSIPSHNINILGWTCVFSLMYLYWLCFCNINILIILHICRAGSVWQCPLTQASDDCSPIHDIVPGSNVPPARDEIRNDQWLGVALTSQGPGGKVMVCAHR